MGRAGNPLIQPSFANTKPAFGVYANMRRSSVVFLLVPFLAAAQQSANHRKPAPPATPGPYAEKGASPVPEERAADSYAIYSMLAPGPELEHVTSGQTWAIADTTVNTDDRNPAVPPEGQLKPPSKMEKPFKEAVEDFEINQHLRLHLSRKGFHIDRDFRLITPEEVNNLRASGRTQGTGYSGITLFIEVYFDSKHTVALVYRSEWCAHLCSAGTWIYLEKQGNRWVQQSGIVVPGA